MRWTAVIVLLLVAAAILVLARRNQGAIGVAPANLVSSADVRSSSASASSTTTLPKPDFETEVKPILQSRCMPCHFQGGKVYDKMPFDKPETITRLGTKLFTRITEEKPREVIRAYLAQP